MGKDGKSYYKNDNGKVKGFTHDAMRSASLIFFTRETVKQNGKDVVKTNQIDPKMLRNWYVDAPKPVHEEDAVKFRDVDPIAFDRVLRVDDSMWDQTDAWITPWSAQHALKGYSYGLLPSVDINDDDWGDAEKKNQQLIYSAVHGLKMEGWSNRMTYYFGAGFYKMQASFRDKEIDEGPGSYRDWVVYGLQNAKHFDARGADGKKTDEGLLSLVYAFAPTGLGIVSDGKVPGETDADAEAKYIAEKLTHLGTAQDDMDFANSLIGGYYLHRAEDNLDLLKSEDGKKMKPEEQQALKDSIESDLFKVGEFAGYNEKGIDDVVLASPRIAASLMITAMMPPLENETEAEYDARVKPNFDEAKEMAHTANMKNSPLYAALNASLKANEGTLPAPRADENGMTRDQREFLFVIRDHAEKIFKAAMAFQIVPEKVEPIVEPVVEPVVTPVTPKKKKPPVEPVVTPVTPKKKKPPEKVERINVFD